MSNAFMLGDSKTLAAGDTPAGAGYLPLMGEEWFENPTRYAVDGIHMADLKANLPAQLAARVNTPEYIFISHGVTDLHTDPYVPLPATYADDYGDVLDMLHTKWPNAHIYLSRVWKQLLDENWAAEIAEIDDTIIPALIAARSDYCHLGPDERVFLENGDNGTTLTSDGVHPNHAGYVAWAAALLDALA